MSNLKHKAFPTFTKVASALTSVATVLSLSGFAALAPVVTNAATPGDYGLHEGDRISANTLAGDPDIYIINDWGYKRLVLSPSIAQCYPFLGTWPTAFLSKVHSVSTATRDAFGYSGLFQVYHDDGTVADQRVWAYEFTGEDTGVLHWVNMSGDQAVAQDANFFRKVFHVNSCEFAQFATSPTSYTNVNQVMGYSRVPGATPTGTSAGNVSVSLASDNPASGTLVKSQAAADLAHFMFTGSGAVNNLVFNRLGVSADTDLANVYLYMGNRRITDAASVTNGMISFNDTSANGLFTVSGSTVISVRADLSSNTGETVGVQLAKVNGNAVSVSGNLFTVANATLGTAFWANAATPATNASLNPANDTVVWQDNVTIGTRAAWLKSLQLRVIGSVLPGDLQNFRLFADGNLVGSSAAPDSNGYIFFDLGAGVNLQTGARTLKVLADVVNGSSRNFTVSLRQAPDIAVVDSQYGQNILATVNTGSFPDSAGTQTIAAGTLQVTKRTDSPSGDVVKGASGIVFGRYDFKAYGERMKVENLRVAIDANNASVGKLRNGALFAGPDLQHMAQIGSTQDINDLGQTPAYTQFNLGSSLIVVPGQPQIVEIRADVYDNDGTDNTTAGDTLQMQFAAGSTNVQPLTSLTYVSVPNATTATANVLTVRVGSFTAAKYSGFANQSVVSPTYNSKLGHFTLMGSSAEDINVNSINFTETITGTFTTSKITNMYIKVWNDSGSLIYTSPIKSTINSSATASNSYSVNWSLPKNKTYQVEVWGDVGSSITAGDSSIMLMDADGVTAASSTTVHASKATGQTVTAQSGTLTFANGAIPVATLANGGSTKTGYAFTVQPAYDDFTLDEVYVDLNNTTASTVGAVANLMLKENGTLISSATVNPSTGSASFVGLGRLLAQAAGTKTYTVDVQLANVGVGANDTGGTLKVRLDGYKYHNSSGTVTTTTGLSNTTYTGNNIVDVAAYPVFVDQTLPSTLLSTGEKTLMKTKVTSSSNTNTVRLYRLVFTVTKTAGPQIVVSGTKWKLFEDGVDISSLGAFASAGGDLTAGSAAVGQVAFTFTNERPVDSNGHVYDFRGNFLLTGSTPQSVVTKIANPSSSVSTDDAVTVAGTLSSSTPSVTWSDGSQVSHALTTDDWMNDYVIQTINGGQTISL